LGKEAHQRGQAGEAQTDRRAGPGKARRREERTASGIVLPDPAKDKPQTARIIAIGDLDDGSVSKGDLVVFARYFGTGITLDEEDYLILDADDLLGIVEE
jgi:chaperonin GroES